MKTFLIIAGLASRLPQALFTGLTAQGVPSGAAHRVADLPPTGALFAALLGYNPIRSLVGPALQGLPAANVAHLTGRAFFPHLISGPFSAGLGVAFDFAVVACVIAAVASWLRGGRYYHQEEGREEGEVAEPTAEPLGDEVTTGAPTPPPATGRVR